jgi:hypothetical protein
MSDLTVALREKVTLRAGNTFCRCSGYEPVPPTRHAGGNCHG